MGDAGKGKSTGDTTKADKKEKGSILEEDGIRRPPNRRPKTPKMPKRETMRAREQAPAIRRQIKKRRIVRREASWRRMTRRPPKRETMRAREKAPAIKKASWVS